MAKYTVRLHIDVETLCAEFAFVPQIQKQVTFFDEHKNKHQGQITLNNGTHCFWDRHPFQWAGISCPVEAQYPVHTKTYVSDINGSKYSIQDSVSSETCTYIVDGLFCCGECCLAFILNNSHNPRYMNSKEMLFHLLRRKCEPAPSWRLLKAYGGSLTIEQFREACQNRTFALEGVLTHPLLFIYKESYHL